MTRHAVLLLLSAGVVWAQTPTPAVSPAATPTPSPSPVATPTPSPTPTARDIINGLKDDDVTKAVQALKESFLDPAKTDDKALKRAELEGLVRRLAPGVELVPPDVKGSQKSETPFLAEILDDHIGYFRIGALNKGDLSQLDSSLTAFKDKKIDAVILDLRGLTPSADFEMAADFARRFCPKGKLLFSVQKPVAKQERLFTSNQEPAFQGVMIVLTDADTAGAAEALAATLRLNANAMIVGATTTGEAVEFTDIALSGGAVLKVAVAQVNVPGQGSIFPNGVTPDVAISLPRDVQEQIFRGSKEKGVSQYVFETERSHMNEASLVANMNPEIDSVQNSQRDRGRNAPLRDTVLQRAVDLITAINFYTTKKQ